MASEPRAPAVPDTLTLEQVQRWCERDEATLRMQHPPEGRFPAEVEDQLARLGPSDMKAALRRWAYLKHLFLLRTERLAAADPAAQNAVRQLLRREPVRVELGGRVARVTGRSYAAMYQLASHALRIRTLEVDVEHAARLYEEVRRSPGWPSWRRARLRRRRLHRLQAVHLRLYAEIRRHRQALYAHALTPDGAPARSADEAPSWWTEIDPVSDAALLAAAYEAGPGRYARLGTPPPAPDRSSSRDEDFGWASLLASIERQQRAEPASYYDRDLFQLLAWTRAGAPPVPEEMEG